jgi:hypothetical protein
VKRPGDKTFLIDLGNGKDDVITVNRLKMAHGNPLPPKPTVTRSGRATFRPMRYGHGT